MPLTQEREWDQGFEVIVGDICHGEYITGHHTIMLCIGLLDLNLHISILSYPSTIIGLDHTIFIDLEHDIRAIMLSLLS
jgi:hypothetical protein